MRKELVERVELQRAMHDASASHGCDQRLRAAGSSPFGRVPLGTGVGDEHIVVLGWRKRALQRGNGKVNAWMIRSNAHDRHRAAYFTGMPLERVVVIRSILMPMVRPFVIMMTEVAVMFKQVEHDARHTGPLMHIHGAPCIEHKSGEEDDPAHLLQR
ncbi:MAG: hypothetical protein IPG35_00260 [Flavobacteriales bacterium]|nr:hypothetical protein [Flavobacteriales bacterium]MBK9699415.1 hypothetical protein [Flavobacteriales bacterium]